MVKTCLAFGCKQKFVKDGNISFFSIPKDKDRRIKWLKAINQRSLDVKPFHVICSKHFKPNDFNIDTSGRRKNLKPFAIPSIFDTKRTPRATKRTTNALTQYNFRTRKHAITPAEKKLAQKSDHTYFTLKPMPSAPATITKAEKYRQPFNDHTYTRLTESAAAPPHHNEHNYSLNDKKRKSPNIIDPHIDHAYLGPPITPNHIISYPDAEEPVVLDLRDHTYSKNNKKKINKKKMEPLEIIPSNDMTECVVLSPIARESVHVREMNQINPTLCILEPKVKEVKENSINGLVQGPYPPTYVLVDPKCFNGGKKADAEQLFVEIFGREPSNDNIVPESQQSCCERVNSEQLLPRCPVRKQLVEPTRNISDYTIGDMSCELNAQKYFESSKMLIDRQTLLIRKLRKQNARLSNRFHRLGEEILRYKKKTPPKMMTRRTKTLTTTKSSTNS